VVERGNKVKFVLFGAGACGRYILAYRREDVICFADNDPIKQNTDIEGFPILSPNDAKLQFPAATWVCSVISSPAREVRAQMLDMLVKTIPLHRILPCHHGLPPDRIRDTLFPAIYDTDSKIEFNDQCVFRKSGDYEYQIKPTPAADIYFPDFILKRDDEHFVDCGAADGDTIKAFLERWKKWGHITAFEPDVDNYAKLCNPPPKGYTHEKMVFHCCAVGDFPHTSTLVQNGDYSSHIGPSKHETTVEALDAAYYLPTPPTFIKMDIEGSELEALWGARRILKEHSPVLAVCAYHTSDHLWQIPLLIHAINPDYKLFLRRYAEGAWELVWYAVPLERIQEFPLVELPVPANHESYSDNHTG
jgi:FkbM family methyltransferase